MPNYSIDDKQFGSFYQNDLGEWVRRVSLTGPSGNPVEVNDSNQMLVVLDGKVDINNSTNTPLVGDGIFQGSSTETLDYAIIFITVFSDVGSATDGLCTQLSSDGITWRDGDCYTVPAGVEKTFSFQTNKRYFRANYVNGSAAQTVFDMQTIFKKTNSKPSSHRINDPVINEDDAELVKAVLSGEDQGGVFQNVKTTEVGNLRVADFLVEVARGNIPGYSLDRKFGSIAGIQAATPADVWSYGITSGAETYTFSADGVADIDRLSSSNSNDNGLTVTIVGLDADGEELSQTVTLDAVDATTPVAITPLWRVNRVFNANGADFLGQIFVFVNGTTVGGVPTDPTSVRGHIPIGEGQSLQSIYTVPANKEAFFVGLEVSLTKAGGATAVGGNFRGRTREFGRVFRTKDDFDLLSSGTSNRTYNLPIPLPFPAKTDFVPTVDVTTNGVGASWAFTVLLIDIT